VRPSAERFCFVSFGARAPEGAAACDGLVPGAILDLSHWEKNATPTDLKRDTSVEIALEFARRGERVQLAVNNHFDADGALAVYALLRSEIALAHAPLLVAAAQAGDFDEWPDDERGLRLEAAVRRLGMLKTDAEAYDRVLRDLERVLVDLDRREDLWGATWKTLGDARDAIARGDVTPSIHGSVALFTHCGGRDELPGPALHRAVKGTPVTHWLLAFERARGTFDYRLERARYAWADTVVRPAISAGGRNALAERLSRALPETAGTWALKGDLGMTGLLRTSAPIAVRPEAIARVLA
jgi:hypothetical protein